MRQKKSKLLKLSYNKRKKYTTDKITVKYSKEIQQVVVKIKNFYQPIQQENKHLSFVLGLIVKLHGQRILRY